MLSNTIITAINPLYPLTVATRPTPEGGCNGVLFNNINILRKTREGTWA
jgi:hypothetical protein